MVGRNFRSENGVTVSLNSKRYCKISRVFCCGGTILGGIYIYIFLFAAGHHGTHFLRVHARGPTN